MAKLVISLLAAVLLSLLPSGCSKHTVIAVLPLDRTDSPTLSWERGLEILPGAQVAIKHVNQHHDSTGNQLKLKVINSGKCAYKKPQLALEFINLTQHEDFSRIGVIGLFCSNSEQLVLNVAERLKVNPIIVSSSMSLITQDFQTPGMNYYRILPSADIFIDAFSTLIFRLRWNRIAVMTESTDSYFFRVAEALYKRATASKAYKVVPFFQLYSSLSVEKVLRELEQSTSNIIFLSASIEKSLEILCTAKRMGLVWPHYAWIMHSVKLRDFVKLAERLDKCDVYEALEGVVLLEHHLNPAYDPESISSPYREDYIGALANLSTELNTSLRSNPYATVLYNSVWVYATAVNNNTPDSIEQVNYSQVATRVVGVYQVENGTATYEGYYDHIRKEITLTGSFRDNPFPSSNHKIVTDRASLVYTAILSVAVLACAVLVTVVFVLYLYYRKEPEIKSTSVSLSLLMFCGCYLILIYLLLALIYTQSLVPSTSPFNICTAIIWLSITGFSLPLILATLLVKMLRVFHIFSLEGKISRLCSDSALLVYVLLIVSPCIMVLILWSAVDPYTASTVITEHTSFTEIEQRCYSRYLLLWIGFMLVNILILIVVLLVVAVKTRKIRRANFKDTKKVNAFLFVLVTMIFLTLSYWMIFRTIGAKKGYSDITLHLSHLIIVVSIQGFLFIPKILAPFKRHILNRYQLKWNILSSSSKTNTTTLTTESSRELAIAR